LILYHALLAASIAFTAAPSTLAQTKVTLTHVHGLAYSADGKQLMVPSHHGLAVYEDGKWLMTPGPKHDYMGFAATRTRLYSSGHPAPDSNFVDPFGLIRSWDGGKTWDRLGLEGESDFHSLAAAWNANAVYVWNPKPNSRMPQPGLHHTLNDGFQWQRAAASDLTGKLHAIAAHPDDAKTVAVATSNGIYLSRDSSASFRSVAQEQGLAVYFDLDGQHLWYGSFAGAPRLTRIALGSGERAPIVLPPLGRDAVAYIAQNPAARMEYAIATFERSIYLSRDAGQTWLQIANRGRGQ
jgi:photosystem II stability/assembly factor-like uncharacterized protein